VENPRDFRAPRTVWPWGSLTVDFRVTLIFARNTL
jgi:hypothetical protein